MTGTALEQVQAEDLRLRNRSNRAIATANVMGASGLLRADLTVEAARAIAITLDQMDIPATLLNINAGYVIKGKVDFMTRIWTALAQRAGYKVWPDDQSDDQTGIAHIRDVSTGEQHTVTFTWADATKAGLVGSPTYKTYGRDMLIWRAMSRAVRFHAPEVMAGMVHYDDDTPVQMARPRPIPERPAASPDSDDDVVDAELVEQGEDVRMPPQEPEGGRENARTHETAPASPRPDWRALAAKHEVTREALLEAASGMAAARDLPAPTTMAEVTDEQLVADVLDWLGE